MARTSKQKTPPAADLLDLELVPPDAVTEPDGVLSLLDMSDEMRDIVRGDGAAGDEEDSLSGPIPELLPLVPIRDNVYFPHMLFPLFVGRDRSVRAIEAAVDGDARYVLLAAQREIMDEDPEPSDIYPVGIVAEVMQHLKMPDNTVRVMLEGGQRVRLTGFVQTEPYLLVKTEPMPTTQGASEVELEGTTRIVMQQFERLVTEGKGIPPESLVSVMSQSDPDTITDTIIPYLNLRVDQKQEFLEIASLKERLEKLVQTLTREQEIVDVQKNIRTRVESEMGDNQREFILREQLKAIQHELGERDERSDEIDEYRTQIKACGMSMDVEERALKELDRFEKTPLASPESGIIRNYLDWLVAMPWNTSTEETLDMDEADRILNADHFGLEKVKERILEFLAVRKLSAGGLKSPILCFVGPPGVGKTSLGKSVATALGRKFLRVSLGGVRDEAEIRGHRRTYVGAMPGRIIQALKTCGSKNPVFLLDEIDKMGTDFRGDPSSALLEALDPEQNSEFSDHYLEVPFDLSDVLFVTTANLLDPVPSALRDRMEVISFTGYIEDEKLAIAERYIVPKQIENHGLTPELIRFEAPALRRLIREYTREAGVRNLEREIGAICRKIARKVASGETNLATVTEDDLKGYLGGRRYHWGVAEEHDEVGAATGLVYTEAGGDTISIEVMLTKSASVEGHLTLTGQLGDVMKESAQAAWTFVRSRRVALGMAEDAGAGYDIHIHVPAGAVPKDGPSAGITIATALASALSGRAIRKDVAMTGEITLRGKVLPVGGLKEKILAAHRAGVRNVILPAENEKDLEEIPADVREALSFKLVLHADEVLSEALLPAPKSK